jgi:hypothetical protein
MCSYSDRMLSGAIHRYPLPYTTTHPMAGRHCPPLTIDGTSPLTDHTTTGRPLLLHPDPDSVTIDDTVDRVTVRSLGHPELEAALLRPDGVIAWAASPGEPLDTTSPQLAMSTWFPQVVPLAMTDGIPRDGRSVA